MFKYEFEEEKNCVSKKTDYGKMIGLWSLKYVDMIVKHATDVPLGGLGRHS